MISLFSRKYIFASILILLFFYLQSYRLSAQSFTSHPELPAASGPVYTYTGFTIQYDEENETAAWVAYELTRSEVKGRVRRSDDYREDLKIKTGSSALEDYYKSGYDRGHLAPAGDMKWSEKAMSESFLLSNITPQHPDFNRGIWRDLEELVRKWALYNGSLLIASGPVKGKSRKTIGKNMVQVPEYFFKVIIDCMPPDYKGIAFIIPNRKCSKTLKNYAVPIDDAEKFTGLDFFYQLPDRIENRLESELDTERWFW